MSLASFPAPRAHGLAWRTDTLTRGLALRAAVDADLSGLRLLYASTRADELAAVPWPSTAKEAFLDQQFALQHRHYLGYYADADFLVIDEPDGLVGRFYRRRAPDAAAVGDADLVIDISLVPHWRCRGVGAALLRVAMEQAAERRRGVQLHVHCGNPRARRFYERLGFVVSGEAGMHLEMRWRPIQA